MFLFWLLAIFVFILGAMCGSFLNCVIYRLETNKSFLKGRSFCPFCQHTLRWYDLAPVLSFFLLKGRCRYCQKPISWQYPVVEISTGLIFLLIFNFQFSPLEGLRLPTGQAIFNFQNILSLIYLLVIVCFLIIIFVYDLKHYIIPDEVVYPAIAITFLYRFFESFTFHVSSFKMLGNFLIAAVGVAGLFFLLWFFSRGTWMGFGDVKLAFFIGIFLGPGLTIAALFTTFLLGAIIGLILVFLKKKGFKSEIPFGPFLVSGTFFALFFGQKVIDWYLNFLTI